MKKLNYTGSSKFKARIAYLLNRKAPLPLDGNDDPDWGTNGQVLSTDGSGNTAWVNQGGGGSGGHTIWGRLKATLTQRSRLWFADANASDASADDATKVEVVTELASESAFDNLATDGTADGIYAFPDSGGEYLTAAMSSYDNTVSGLSASDVQGAIDKLAQIGGVSVQTQTVVNNGMTFEFHKIGHLAAVVLLGGSATSSVPATGTLVNIPDGYKPCAEGFQATIAFGHSGRVGLWNWTGGTITVQDALPAGATPRFSVTYICQ